MDTYSNPFPPGAERFGGRILPQVLDALFFAEAARPDAAACAADHWTVQVPFRGQPSGCFRLKVDRSLARELAAGFLGCDSAEIDDDEGWQVACELAAMVCGSVLSRAKSGCGFELCPACAPEEQPGVSWTAPDYHAGFVSDLGGAIEMEFRLELPSAH